MVASLAEVPVPTHDSFVEASCEKRVYSDWAFGSCWVRCAVLAAGFFWRRILHAPTTRC
jgi:hypothetical protein